MSIRRLKTLVAVAEEGSFAAAADAVHLSQGAVSMQMKALEEDLQVELFDRSKRPPELNEAGRALVPKARELIELYAGMVDIAAGNAAFFGSLTIGAVPTALAGLIPKTLAALRDSYPDLRVRVVPGLSADLMTQIERGQLDAAIMTGPPRPVPHLTWRVLAEEPLILLAPPGTEGDDPIELLRTQPFIRFSRQAWVGRDIDDWLRRKGLRVRETMELDSLDVISTMVYHNLGVSIVPLRCVDSPIRLPNRRMALGTDIKPRLLGLMSSPDSSKAPLLDAAFRTMVDLVREEAPSGPARLEG